MAVETYSVENYYTASTDAKGHGTTFRLYIPPTILYQCGRIVASRKVPQYRTKEDIGRDALYHRLHWINENVDFGDSDLDRTLSMWDIRMQMQQQADRVEEAEELFSFLADKTRKGENVVDEIKAVLNAYDLPRTMREQFETLLGRAELMR